MRGPSQTCSWHFGRDITVTRSLIEYFWVQLFNSSYEAIRCIYALQDITSVPALRENNWCARNREKRRSRKQLSAPPGSKESQLPICTTTHWSPQSIMVFATGASISPASWALRPGYDVSSIHVYGWHPRACTPSYRPGTLIPTRSSVGCGK